MTDFYRVPTFCPVCHRKPAFRAYPEQVLLARGMDPATPLISLQCPDKGCGRIFPVTASDFQRATKERRKAA